jgi:hypothetical protein
MSRTARTATIFIATCLVILFALGTAGLSSAKKKAKPLKVTCDQLYVEVRNVGAQLQSQYNAKGFTIGLPQPAVPDPDDPSAPIDPSPPIDGVTSKGACQKQGKRVRMGGGFMSDVHSPGEPFFPGETNPAIREYFWYFSVTVTRLKTGALRDALTDVRCEKYIYDGSAVDPHNLQTLPC